MNATNGKTVPSPKPTTPAPTSASPALAPGDQLMMCCDAGKRPQCQKEFVFTAGEKQFFETKGFSPPRRCKPCRDAKKAEKEAGNGGFNPTGGYSTPDTNPNDNYSGGGGRGGKKRRGGRGHDDF